MKLPMFGNFANITFFLAYPTYGITHKKHEIKKFSTNFQCKLEDSLNLLRV